MKNHIDSLDGINTSKLTFSDIAMHYMTGFDISSGDGRNKTHKYRHGMQTDIGDIRSDIWCELARVLIQQAGEEDLYKNLHKFMSLKNHPIVQKPDELRQYTLGLHVARIFDNPAWIFYIPFNRKFRPERLKEADIIEVFFSCCRKSGEITKQQISTESIEKKAFCSFCGRITTFQTLKE